MVAHAAPGTDIRACIGLVREAKRKDVQAKAHLAAEGRVLDALVGATASPATREAFRKRLRAGESEVELKKRPRIGPRGMGDFPRG